MSERKPAAPDQDKLYGTGMLSVIKTAICEHCDYESKCLLMQMMCEEDIDNMSKQIFSALVRTGWAFNRYR